MPKIIIGIYTHKCQVLLLEYAVLPGTLGTWMLQFKHLLSVPFFLFVLSWKHILEPSTQRHLSKFSFIVHLPYMMLLINTAGWKKTSCRKKIKTRMISHYIVEYLPSYWNHLWNILECLGYVRSTFHFIRIKINK